MIAYYAKNYIIYPDEPTQNITSVILEDYSTLSRINWSTMHYFQPRSKDPTQYFNWRKRWLELLLLQTRQKAEEGTTEIWNYSAKDGGESSASGAADSMASNWQSSLLDLGPVL